MLGQVHYPIVKYNTLCTSVTNFALHRDKYSSKMAPADPPDTYCFFFWKGARLNPLVAHVMTAHKRRHSARPNAWETDFDWKNCELDVVQIRWTRRKDCFDAHRKWWPLANGVKSAVLNETDAGQRGTFPHNAHHLSTYTAETKKTTCWLPKSQ